MLFRSVTAHAGRTKTHHFAKPAGSKKLELLEVLAGSEDMLERGDRERRVDAEKKVAKCEGVLGRGEDRTEEVGVDTIEPKS